MQAARRLRPAILYLLLAGLALTAVEPAFAFGFAEVSERARKLAAEPYRKPETDLPKSLRELTYDQHRDIRFRPDRSLWRGTGIPFELQFFHLGFLFNQPVRVRLITAEGVKPVPFTPRDFHYGANKLDLDEFKDLGHAGFRVHYPLHSSEYKDELVVFLGASYFRALGKNQIYGLSARGLAVDTASMSGEEFPVFTEFWIKWPPKGSRELEIFALLESRRVTGAYRFVLRPGDETHMDVRARLFLREPVEKLGIAPLTSMYFFGENQHARVADYRPEVHDSDGLLIQSSSGEWIWRPLVNPRRLLVTSFALRNPRGFGLLQRDRDFSHYQDLEARYDRRPSAWITPRGDWGAGRVELVQLPTPDETNDNVVAYWVPEQQPEPGKPLDLQYRLSWQHDRIVQPPLASVAQTRSGHGYRQVEDDSLRFIVDFEGETLKKLPAEAKVEGLVWLGSNAELLENQIFRNPVTGGWRLSLRMRRKDEEPVEMRAILKQKQGQISETWSYILP